MNMMQAKLRSSIANYQHWKQFLSLSNKFKGDKKERAEDRAIALAELNKARGELWKIVTATTVILYGQNKPPVYVPKKTLETYRGAMGFIPSDKFWKIVKRDNPLFFISV